MALRLTFLAILLVIAVAACRPAPSPAPGPPRQTNAAGIRIIKDIEGLRREPYKLHGCWYVGYGHALGGPMKGAITKERAETLLRQDLEVCEETIREAVTVPVNANEFSAMASLCYTTGAPAFKDSGIVERLNAGNRRGAADAFLLYTKARDGDGTMTTLDILKERRQRERTLFLEPAAAAASS